MEELSLKCREKELLRNQRHDMFRQTYPLTEKLTIIRVTLLFGKSKRNNHTKQMILNERIILKDALTEK